MTCYVPGGSNSVISSKIIQLNFASRLRGGSKNNLKDSREGMKRTSIRWNTSLQPFHFSTFYTSYENCGQNGSASPNIMIDTQTTSDVRLKAVNRNGSVANLRSGS